ncbi:MFS transporter [Amycolatopsis mongoliensis]|uniref:MFS transporter n=1 Tax=Amycolatopsis mongoliensis TaxID=715475 RepID=A0A9Y2JJJ8_9PSEU|nr:MFS transporter [Amycolatopsis sp. 4-36]WIX98478.1 MFS transporter [Amycolatopsis sp. 4-36]
MSTRTDRPPSPSRRASIGFRAVAAVYVLAMLGGTLPVPLYVLWAPRMGFGPFTTTAIFAIYAVGVAVALLLFAPMSDRAGRRPLLLVSLVALAASTACFLAAHDVAMLLLARFLYGIATGVITATATAALEELAGPGRARTASMTASGANLGGLALGTVVAGVFAEFAPDPTHLVYWCYLGTLVPATVAIVATPETVRAPRSFAVAVRRPAMPAGSGPRRQFLSAAAAVFAAFAVNGLFSSLVPGFLRDGMHVRSAVAVGAEVGLLFAVALAAQLVPPARWPASHPLFAPVALVVGVAVFETGLWTHSLPAFVTGTVFAGIGAGLVFRQGIAVTAGLAVPGRRADLFASYFLAAYAGLIGPTLLLGLLDQVLDQNIATLLLAAGVGGIALAAAGTRGKEES